MFLVWFLQSNSIELKTISLHAHNVCSKPLACLNFGRRLVVAACRAWARAALAWHRLHVAPRAQHAIALVAGAATAASRSVANVWRETGATAAHAAPGALQVTPPVPAVVAATASAASLSVVPTSAAQAVLESSNAVATSTALAVA